MAAEERKKPNRARSVLLALYALFLFGISHNTFLFRPWLLYTGCLALAGAYLIGRFGFGKRWSLLYTLAVYLSLYNPHFVLGGFLYLRGWGLTLLAGIFSGMAILLRRRALPVIMGHTAIVICILGLILLYGFRNWSGELRCAEELDPIVQVLDAHMHPYEVIPGTGENDFYAAYGLDGEVRHIMEGENGPSVTTIRTGLAGRGAAQRLGLDANTGRLFAPLWGAWGRNELLVVIDTTSDKITREVPLEACVNAFETAIDRNTGTLVLLCENSHSLLKLDLDSVEPLDTLTFRGANSYSIELNEAARLAYISDWLSPWLTVIDLDRFEVRSRHNVGFFSFGMALSSDGSILYLAKPFPGTVKKLDASTLEEMGSFRAGYGVRDLDIGPTGRRLVTANYFDGTVDVIDAVTGEGRATVRVGSVVRDVLIDPKEERVLVSTLCGIKFFALADAWSGTDRD